ncbi:winged helix-turn-helix domain-containing protein [Streptomyces lydicus]|uniref:winged helix-turn-helix domain-containing protein n=1 Tax=Streptomyces lydicus TaxID=47763 RepID=UPI00378D698E
MRALLVGSGEGVAGPLSSTLRADGWTVWTRSDVTCRERGDYCLPDVVVVVDRPSDDDTKLIGSLANVGRLYLSSADQPAPAFRPEGWERTVVMRYPFSLARITECMQSLALHDQRQEILSVGTATLDPLAGTVARAGRGIDLGRRGCQLLHCLMQNPGQWVSRDHLLHEVWGHDFEHSTDVVAIYMNHVRRKFDASQPQMLFHDPAAGYMIKAAGSPA